jgi:hypothetical protein
MSDFRGETLSAEGARNSDEIQRLDREAKTRHRASRVLHEMPPRLRAIYRQFIETRPVNSGERHAFLLRVIPAMFEVVAEPVLVDLLDLHHRAQTGIWRTVLDDHMKEAEEMLADYGAKYRETLGERERIVFYDRLSDAKRRAAFRICRGLASCDQESASGAFFLSCAELAVRINCNRDTAHTILREFKAKHLIETVKVGDSYRVSVPEGKRREATRWRWAFSTQAGSLLEEDANRACP